MAVNCGVVFCHLGSQVSEHRKFSNTLTGLVGGVYFWGA